MPQMEMQGRFLSASEVADWLGVAPKWVYRHAGPDSPDGIPHYRVGGHLRFRRSEIEAWLESRRREPINAA